MTDSGPLFAQLMAGLDDTMDAILDTLVDSLPGYASMPDRERNGPLREVIRHTLDSGLQHCASNEIYTAHDADFFRNQGAKRGCALFPLEDFTAAFSISAAVAQRAFWHTVDPRYYRELAAIGAFAAHETPRMLDEALAGYANARRYDGDARPGHDLLIQRLVAGLPATTMAAGADIDLPEGYAVVLCAVDNADSVSDQEREQVVHHLAAIPGALFHGNLQRLLVLLPMDLDRSLTRRIATDTVVSIAKLTRQSVRAAHAHRTGLDAIPDAYAEAEEILMLVAAIPDATNHAYILDELLVELAIAHRPDIAVRIAGLLASLDAGNDLRQTVEVLFACDLDRERTAKALCIHRRTLSYRLNRIRALSGIDPASAHGITLLRAALTAARLTTS